MNTIYEAPSHDDLLKMLHAVLVEIRDTDDIDYANRLANAFQNVPIHLLNKEPEQSASKTYNALLNAAIPNQMDVHIHRFRNTV